MENKGALARDGVRLIGASLAIVLALAALVGVAVGFTDLLGLIFGPVSSPQ